MLGQLFPEKRTPANDKLYERGRIFFLRLLRLLFQYERRTLPFDPTVDMHLLTLEEVAAGHYTSEYRRFEHMARSQSVYEFMRIGVEITPYNTLGHIAGVHYVAMHVARQLAALGVPVDLALVSGAAAGHDIGKYGCKKSEERRIPYLHYYYTDHCFERFRMPLIGHIATNHSTWDLELENLSAESLILIYADFRVKSSRDASGTEIVHFYSLADAFQVILHKLDNVDAAKELRYRRVYNKLKDFEDYMEDLGVVTALPAVPAPIPARPAPRPHKDRALLQGDEIVTAMKFAAVDHNIRLMNRFYHEEEFSDFLESARSEKQWKNLRTYVSILGEYSTYMTEKQKLMTLRFLTELLAHRESDIRTQAGNIIGRIIARFNIEYTKELPAGVDLPPKKVTNLSLWTEVLHTILCPDRKLTDQHKRWMGDSLKYVLLTLLVTCRPQDRDGYIDALLTWYERDDLTYENKSALLQAAISIPEVFCNKTQTARMLAFAERVQEEADMSLSLTAIALRHHFHRRNEEAGAVERAYINMDDGQEAEARWDETDREDTEYLREIKSCMGLDPDRSLSREALSDMYLDNLKAQTPWPVKIANIRLMLDYLRTNPDDGQALHVATHLGNLAKVSETVTVRRSAGMGLLSIIGHMPLEQRNEIAVELGKGLEIGDYQFSKYIPNYLGILMLHLPPQELDELIDDLEKFLEGTGGQVASAALHTFGVMLEYYHIYRENFGDAEPEAATEARRTRLINMIIRGAANYNRIISQEALWSLGVHVFGSRRLSLEEKARIFRHCAKKVLTLYDNLEDTELDFFHTAAVLNQIYRFISQYEVDTGAFNMPVAQKIAFFPGTFDPFSLSHKAIAREIRNMGCEVYLALDEFSWSKKTQPRLQRRRIMGMSVADEENIYIFPDDIPVNIANPSDLRRLKELFAGRELYFVAGSDVIENASCYRTPPAPDSIHSFNHIIFKRASAEQKGQKGKRRARRYPISGRVINLHLAAYYEDISSTRIRENIDLNRDISNLIDPVAQNYITENSLYLREPAYKHIIQTQDISIGSYQKRGAAALDDLADELTARGFSCERIAAYLERPDVMTVVIRDGKRDDRIVALAAVHHLDSIDLLREFNDQDIATFIRAQAAGGIAVLGGLYCSRKSTIQGLSQILLTEVLSSLLARDYTYVVYHPCEEGGQGSKSLEVFEKQGFVNIAPRGQRALLAVNMKSPVILFKNVETLIKHPLDKNPRVLRAIEEAHNRLLRALTTMFPGELLLTFNAGIMHHKMIQRITRLNHVPETPTQQKIYGPYMAVPFGKVLSDVAVPNTVTKALHTEKYFYGDLTGFSIEESSFYSALDTQVKTIRSFNRPVILVDDLLHKGYRMKELDPILKENGVEVVETVVGVLTGRGRDMMTVKERTVDSAYFLPNLKCWIDETAIYPYIGGDGIKDRDMRVSRGRIPSLNLILPYTAPTFLAGASNRDMYEYSMVCLENAHSILRTLEEEYQAEFERKLTLKRLGEVITQPKRPDLGGHVAYDENVAASVYVEKDMQRLLRLRRLFR